MAFTTRGSLLSAVRRGDEIGWRDFYDNYKPLILLRGGDRYLNQTEKEDLVQDVMKAFFNTSKTFRYDRSLGRFRTYLKRIIDNRAYDIIKKRQDHTVSIDFDKSDDLGIEDLPAEADDHWKTEWQKYRLKQALEDVKPTISSESYQIFHAVAIDHLPIEEAVKIFGKSANTIYGIKCRVAKKLKVILESYDE